jgi:hypothetical protein
MYHLLAYINSRDIVQIDSVYRLINTTNQREDGIDLTPE